MTNGVTSGLIRMSQENEAATYRSVEPHLEPGEEVAAIVALRRKGGKASTLFGARIEVTPAAVELPKWCTLAVTPRRVLVLSHPYGTGDPSTMLIARPLDEVRDVRLGRALGAKELSWTAGGTQYVLSANGRVVKQFAEALQPGPPTA